MIMRIRAVVLGLMLLFGIGIAADGGIRGPGKYCGVVVFDRWGGCVLNSSVYLMYISENVKESLREYSGKCIQLDALKVVQPGNPGDGLIRKLLVVGDAPESERWQTTTGVKITATPDFHDPKTPQFDIHLKNENRTSINISLDGLGMTVLRKGKSDVSDGPSHAVITRNSLWMLDPVNRSGRLRKEFGNRYYSGKLLDSDHETPPFQIFPGESAKMTFRFQLPPGEYEFFMGYGGGVHETKSIVSNAIGFDIAADGSVSEVPARNQ